VSIQWDFIEAYAARWGCEESYASGLLDHVLEEHAHELAEVIRLHRDEALGAAQATKVVAFCADLIDPEVE
jgi:hypothetical protein